MKRLPLLLIMLTMAASHMAGARDGFSEIQVVPVPGKVTVDGDLKDWDLSGAIETFYDESMLPNFSVKLAFMYDAEAFYIAADFVDETPMVNAHDPNVEPDVGWAGDCLQVRLCSDPAEKYPLIADTVASQGNDRICHLTMWYFTPRKEPVLDVRYSMAYHGAKLLAGTNSGLAFTKHSDGKGYVLEGRIPWTLLNVKDRPLKPGDAFTLTAQPLWGSADGRQHRITFNEIVRQSGFGFQNTASWGRAILSKTGNIPPARRPMSEAKRKNPLTLKLNLPDAQAKVVSAMLFDAAGKSVRTLPATVREDDDHGAALEFAWDGLDDRGRALPAGEYTVKLLTHRGTGQRYLCSLHNSGNPPWKTDDGTGAWGGDWDDPLAAAFDGERVYLGWGFCEGGNTEIVVDQKLTKDGNIRKIWGAGLGGTDVLWGLTALAVNDGYVFLARDGAFVEKIPETIHAGVSLVRRKDGSPANFPFGGQGGSRNLVFSDYPSKLVPPARPLFELRKTNAFGPQYQDLNLIGLAVSGDVLYGSLVLENKIVAFDWKTGQKAGELAAQRPAGLQVRPDGKLVAAAGNDIIEIDPGLKQSRVLAKDVLEAPYGLALDKAGNIYVSDQGTAMQVKVFSADGKPLRTVGKKGGRPWIGKYDPQGMLMPRGITVDAEGKLWVAEKDNSPRRVSVWSADGKLVGDFHGPSCPQNDRRADLDNPELVNLANVLYKVDYRTGKAECVSTPWRPFVCGWTPAYGYRLASCYDFRTYKGQRYAWLRGCDGMTLIFKLDGYELKPIASYGYGHGVPLKERGSVGYAKDPREILPDQFAKFCFFNQDFKGGLMEMKRPMHRWVDRNGDGLMQGEELDVWVPNWESGAPRFVANFIDPDLTIWARWQDAIFRIPVESWTKDGIPIYPDVPTVKPLFVARDRNLYDVLPDPDGNRIYTFYQEGGDITKRGDYASMVCYDYSGNVLWEYALAWPCFALDSPFWKPGYLIGTGTFMGLVKLDSGIKLLMTNGYYGDYHCVTTEGLWVGHFCKDNRLGSPADADTNYIENFTGHFYRNKDNGKIYLIGGDTDGRIWELTGLDTIRTAQAKVSISAADSALAAQAAKMKATGPARLPELVLRKAGKVTVDGQLDDWPMDKACGLDAGGGRTAKIALAYDEQNLYAAFDVADASPMRNQGGDWSLLFKTGDVCDVMLAADPAADPNRKAAAPGDLRVLFSVMQGKPVCVLYESKVRAGEKAPKTFTSPTGQETFERVAVLDAAQVAVQRSDKGYVLEAAVPLSAIGFSPRPGTKTRADLGVLFSNDGGGRTVRRAHVANQDTSIVEDVPSEARLQPANWATLSME